MATLDKGYVAAWNEKHARRERERILRLAKANEFLRAIASRGCQYFWSAKTQKVAELVMHQDRIYYVNEWTAEHVRITRRNCDWAGFHHGGTLKSCVQALVDFIRTGEQLSSEVWVLGNSPSYAETHIQEIRAMGILLEVLKPAKETA